MARANRRLKTGDGPTAPLDGACEEGVEADWQVYRYEVVLSAEGKQEVVVV